MVLGPRHRLLPTPSLIRLLFAAAFLPLFLIGCGEGSPAPVSGVALSGVIHGGQQPVSGASIVLYAAGAAGNGLGAMSLLGTHVVTTDKFGGFSITGEYMCPSASTQVYLVARGGNPGLAAGTTNAALTMMVALGNCGDLTSATTIYMDEVTTAAAAWALSQFAGVGQSIGSSATNATGLANAFAVAKSLADTKLGTAPGALPTGASTETTKINTLANSLASCVNSDGTTGCVPLFTAATVNGVAPTTTFDAALNVVRNPANNVSGVWSAATGVAPFQPSLTSAPHDWTLSVTYGKCTSGCGGLSLPGAIGVDKSGDVWVANYSSAVLSEFSPVGAATSANGYPGVGLNESYGLTIDNSGSVWVTNYNSVTNAGNSRHGSLSQFSSIGTELSGYGYTGGGLYYPIALSATSDGNVWAADHSGSSASLYSSNGTAVSGSSGYATSLVPFPYAVATDVSNGAWFAAQGAVVHVTESNVTTSTTVGGEPNGVAVDASGDVWVTDYSGSQVDELSAAGTLLRRTVLNSGTVGPQGVAVDGSGNIWVSNYFGDSLMELSGVSAAVQTPAAGLGMDSPLDSPYGIAIDASGNLWLSNAEGNSLTAFVGLASPIKTPLLGPPSQP